LTFGFVVHPLSRFQRQLLGLRSLDLNLWLRGHTRRAPARVIARLELDDPFGVATRGVLVCIPHLPEQLLGDQEAAVAAVADGVALCAREGADVVGLGAVAAVIGGQGKAVARTAAIPVSTGNGFTTLAALETCAGLSRVGLLRGPVGLIGPPGPVATGLLRGLVARGEHVQVVAARPPAPLRKLAAAIGAVGPGRIDFVDDPAAVLGPGRVLVAASSTGGRLNLTDVPAGSIVVDVAEPQDVRRDCPSRDDVLVLDGEYVRLPRPLKGGLWRSVYSLVTGQRRAVFACFAEPMLMALAGDTGLCSVGRDVPLDRVRALSRLAARHGFFIDRLHEGGRPISAARLRRFRPGDG